VGERKVYTARQVGRMLGLSKPRIYELLRSNQIPNIRLGRRVVIPVAAFEEWLRTAGKVPVPAPVAAS
jgi:excisionase family DNA binding protein